MDGAETALGKQAEQQGALAQAPEGRKADHTAVFSALGVLLGTTSGAPGDAIDLAANALRVFGAELSRADVSWIVERDGFRVGDATFASPEPVAQAARRLHAAGIRALHFIIGFGEAEWGTLVSWLRDDADDEDALTRWIDIKLPHVTVDVALDPRGTDEARAEAKKKLERARAATIAVLKTANATAVVVEGDAVKAAYERGWEFAGSFDAGTVEEVDAIVAEWSAGILFGNEEGVSPDTTARLTRALAEAARRDDALDPGRPFEIVGHLEAWSARNARAELAAGLARHVRATFPADVLATRVRRLGHAAAHPHTDRNLVLRDGVMRGLAVVLEAVDEQGVVLEVCEILDAGCPAPLSGVLERFLRFAARAHAAVLASRVVTARAELGVALVEALFAGGAGDPTPRVERALANPTFEVKLAAIARLGEPLGERARHELVSLLESPDPAIRRRTLETVESIPLVAAGPLVVRRIQSEAFTELPIDERRLALAVVHALKPSRAEALAVEILTRRRLLAEEEYEETRVLCAELLARSSSYEVAQALEDVAKQKWGTSQAVRDAAEAALLVIRERLPKKATVRPGA